MASHYLARFPPKVTISTAKSEIECGWETGNLRCLLQEHQKPVYDLIKDWAANPPDSAALGALYDSMFVLDLPRRWGKTGLCLVIEYEWGITLPSLIGRAAILTYATREKDQIKRIVLPLHRLLTNKAPEDVAPRYYGSHVGMQEGLYFPHDQTLIKLVGVDKDAARLRGEGSDGGVFSEAGHMDDLHENVTGVFMPQFQQRPHAKVILESSAPVEIEHDFDEHFVVDAKLRGAYAFGTLDDNTTLSQAEKDKALREIGGATSIRARREYYGERLRDPERTVLPEFDPQRHVAHIDTPDYACAVIGQDPGSRDLFGIVWGYWHYELDKLVIQRSWAQRNAGTADVAQVLLQTNEELWEPPEGAVLRWWDGPEEHRNPALNVSDIELRLQRDLNTEYDMHVRMADKSKTGHGVGEAKLYKLRDAFKADKIVIEPDSGPLESHLRKATWNEQRTDMQRHAAFGHFDCMMALLYLWNALGPWRNRNPNPPPILVSGRVHEGMVLGPNYVQPRTTREQIAAAVHGDAVPHPAPAIARNTGKTPFSRCPVCSRWRRCDIWVDTLGRRACSQECSDRWTHRATGGKAPSP